MKINNTKNKTNKTNQKNPIKLSPNHKNKNKKEININKTKYKLASRLRIILEKQILFTLFLLLSPYI